MLLQFVQKSMLKQWMDAFETAEKALPVLDTEDDLVKQARIEKPYLIELKKAILDGDTTHHLLQEERCDIWLTYLYHSQQINSDDFLQTYFYLLAKQSFPEKAIVVNSNSPDSLPLIKPYLLQLANVTKQPVSDLIKNNELLNGFNCQWIFIPLDEANEKDKLLAELISFKEEPIPIRVINNGNQFLVVIPPVEFVNLLLKKINPTHLTQPQPIFGVINTDTLLKDLLQKHLHPINLASSAVRKNLISAHGLTATPLSIAAHDFYFHHAKKSLIPTEQLDTMLDILILADEIKSQLSKDLDNPHPSINKAINRLIDLNPPIDMNNPELAIKKWLMHISPLNINTHKKLIREKLESVSERYYLFILALSSTLIKMKDVNGIPSNQLTHILLFSNPLEESQFIKNGISMKKIINLLLKIGDTHHLKQVINAITLLQSHPSLATKQTLRQLIKNPANAIVYATGLISTNPSLFNKKDNPNTASISSSNTSTHKHR